MWIGRQDTSRVVIENNWAHFYGGAIAVVDKVYLGRVDVINNEAGTWQYTYSGGGIYTEGLLAVTSTTNISNNQSIGYGGGIYVTSTGTLQIEYMPYIDGNTNTNNEASDIYLSHNADSGASAKIKIINSLYKTADSGTMAVPIGLRVGKTETAFTTGWANAAQAISDVFVSEKSGNYIASDTSGELKMAEGYLVTIDPNDGATTGTSGYMASITWADTASYRPSRTGYTFKGWTTVRDDASTLVLSSSVTSYTPTKSVTLYGLWEVHAYNITYSLNGGNVEGWTPTNFTATYGESYMLVPSTTPTRSGYTFTGWTMTYYGQRNGALGEHTVYLPEEYIGATIPFDEPEGITQANITIKANWKARTVSSIKITDREYTVQSYFVGDELKSFNITVTYDNNETAKVTVTKSMVSNFSTATTTGAKTATITYEGKTASFTYTVTGYAYKVEHYLQKITFDGYEATPWHTETLYGVGTTNAVARSYEGFTAKTVEQVNIAEDGTSVVKVYYDKNAPTLTTNKYDLDDDGNYDEVYELASEWDLKWFASQVNAGSPDLNAVLMNNISLTTEHIPIGVRTITGYKTYKTYVFTGMFDGQGYCVENLYIKVTTEANRQNGKSLTNGLFGITDNAIIKNVTVVAPVIDVNVGAWAASYPSSGGVVGYAENTSIENCYVKSGINTLHSSTEIIAIIYTTSQDSLRMYFVSCGGLVGYSNNSIIRNCSVDEGTGSFKIDPTMDASGRLGRDENAGGLVGYALSTVIENCYVSDVDLLNYSWDYQGGLAGYFSSSGRITNCYSYNESVGTISSSCITQNVYSSYETNAFADCDEEYGTNLHSQWYNPPGST